MTDRIVTRGAAAPPRSFRVHIELGPATLAGDPAPGLARALYALAERVEMAAGPDLARYEFRLRDNGRFVGTARFEGTP